MTGSPIRCRQCWSQSIMRKEPLLIMHALLKTFHLLSGLRRLLLSRAAAIGGPLSSHTPGIATYMDLHARSIRLGFEPRVAGPREETAGFEVCIISMNAQCMSLSCVPLQASRLVYARSGGNCSGLVIVKQSLCEGRSLLG